jgi:hypothetical protein
LHEPGDMIVEAGLNARAGSHFQMDHATLQDRQCAIQCS